MEVKMKHRVVGILVIVALAVIIFPMIFTHSGTNTEKRQLSLQIPTPPPKPQVQLSLPQPAKTVDLTASPIPANATAINTTAKTKPSITRITTTKTHKTTPLTTREKKGPTFVHKTVVKTTQLKPAKAQAYSIQLAAFTDIANASALVKKLQKAGFTAYTKQSNAKKGRITRVMVGPVIQKTKAESMLKQLQKQFNLNGIVIQYKV